MQNGASEHHRQQRFDERQLFRCAFMSTVVSLWHSMTCVLYLLLQWTVSCTPPSLCQHLRSLPMEVECSPGQYSILPNNRLLTASAMNVNQLGLMVVTTNVHAITNIKHRSSGDATTTPPGHKRTPKRLALIIKRCCRWCSLATLHYR